MSSFIGLCSQRLIGFVVLLCAACGGSTETVEPATDTGADIDLSAPDATVPDADPVADTDDITEADPFETAGFPVSLDAGELSIGPLKWSAGGSGPCAAGLSTRMSTVSSIFLLGFYTFNEDNGPWRARPISALVDMNSDTIPTIELVLEDGGTATLSVVGDRTVQLKVTAPEGDNRISLCLNSPASEKFLGLGGQAPRLQHRGHRVPIWVTEQGLGKSIDFDYDEFGPAFAGRPYDAYFPVPFLLSSRGYGLVVENTERMMFDLAAQDPERLQIEVWSGEATFTFMSGELATALGDYVTRYGGPVPELPDWAWLPWVAMKGGTELVAGRAATLREQKIAAGAIWAEDWLGEVSNPFTGINPKYHWEWDPEFYPDLSALIDSLHAMGLRFLGYFNPFIVEGFDEFDIAVENGFLPTRADGTPYEMTVLTDNGSVLDVTSPDARAWFETYAQTAVELGIDGWMADFAEWAPFDAVFADGRTGASVSSDYPRLWQTLNQAVCNGDCLYFVRSGFTGSHATSPVVWAGDQNTDFGQDDGLPTALRIGVGLGLAGVAAYGSDIAGYTSSVTPPSDKELFFRWTELGAFQPIMRTHEGNVGPENHWYDEDEETLEHFRRYADVHTALYPFWRAQFAASRATGLPIVRHPALHYPDQPAMWDVTDVYLLGDAMWVAPVVSQGATSRDVPLPAGRWCDYWTGDCVEGGGTVSVDAPLGTIPVLVRAGGLVPTLGQSVLTPEEAAATAAQHLAVLAVLGADGEFVLADGAVLKLTSSSTVDPGELGQPVCVEASQVGCTSVAGSIRTYRLAPGTELLGTDFAFQADSQRRIDLRVVFSP